LHAPAAQAYGVQLVVDTGVQLPAPSQVDAALRIDADAWQPAGAQAVPEA
jgi:hypothetical protein